MPVRAAQVGGRLNIFGVPSLDRHCRGQQAQSSGCVAWTIRDTDVALFLLTDLFQLFTEYDVACACRNRFYSKVVLLIAFSRMEYMMWRVPCRIRSALGVGRGFEFGGCWRRGGVHTVLF